MLLSYETSSLAYDDIDLIHGKFVPAKVGISCGIYTNDSHFSLLQPSQNNIKQPSIRIFCNIYGVFANLTGRFAERYDDYVVPCKVECVVDCIAMINTIPQSAVQAIMEEDGFWRGMKSYPWYMLLMQEIYFLCSGEYYLIVNFHDSVQLEDRTIWVWRHFGNVSRSHTLILSPDTAPRLMIRSRNDILIDADLSHIEKWCDAEGSGFWWPELDGNCKNPAKYLSKRIRLLRTAVDDLKKL